MEQNVEILRIWITEFKFIKNDFSNNVGEVIESEDTVKIEWGKEDEEKENRHFRAITSFNYIDEQFSISAEVAGEFLYFGETDEIDNIMNNNSQEQLDLVESAYEVMTDKFDLYVGLFSQEVYNAATLPRRTRTGIEKINKEDPSES